MRIHMHIEGGWESLEPRCEGAWRPELGFPGGAPGEWRASCPVCAVEFTASTTDEAIDLATAHCGRENLRRDIEALKAELVKRSAP